MITARDNNIHCGLRTKISRSIVTHSFYAVICFLFLHFVNIMNTLKSTIRVYLFQFFSSADAKRYVRPIARHEPHVAATTVAGVHENRGIVSSFFPRFFGLTTNLSLRRCRKKKKNVDSYKRKKGLSHQSHIRSTPTLICTRYTVITTVARNSNGRR